MEISDLILTTVGLGSDRLIGTMSQGQPGSEVYAASCAAREPTNFLPAELQRIMRQPIRFGTLESVVSFWVMRRRRNPPLMAIEAKIGSPNPRSWIYC